jgi:hypothetical protein
MEMMYIPKVQGNVKQSEDISLNLDLHLIFRHQGTNSKKNYE